MSGGSTTVASSTSISISAEPISTAYCQWETGTRDTGGHWHERMYNLLVV